VIAQQYEVLAKSVEDGAKRRERAGILNRKTVICAFAT